LGGVPSVVADAADEELAVCERVARNANIMTWLRHRVAADSGAMVASVNSKLAVALVDAPGDRGEGNCHHAGQRALTIGAHPEVLVEAVLQGTARQVRWRGFLDVIRVTKERLVLVDYKSGAEDPAHREQLALYALLFARDLAINPQCRRATELVLVYENGKTITWEAPDDPSLSALEESVMARWEESIVSIAARPPTARPGEACRFCLARAHCSAYWGNLRALPSTEPTVDVELEVDAVAVGGDEIVGTVVHSSDEHIVGRIRVLVSASSREKARAIESSHRVRVLSAEVLKRTEADRGSDDLVLMLGSFAEFACVDEQSVP
jgi:hypothetical protein